MIPTSRAISWKIFRRVVGLVTVLAVLWTCLLRPMSARTGPAPADIGDGWNIATPAAEGLDAAALNRSINALFDAPLNLHAVLVQRHGRLVAETYQGGKDRSVYALVSTRQSFGPAVKQDVRSIGKSVTSLLYGIALDEGRVPAMSTPVLAAYPALADLATPEKNRITIDDLLNMANGLRWQEGGSGVNDELRLYWKNDIPRYVLSHGVATAPNTAFNYNGGGTAILADLITRGAEQPLDAYARRRLFGPLGIRDWEWVADMHGRPMAFNGLRLRPRDLLKIGRLVLDDGRWQGRQVVPAAWIQQSLQPRFTTEVRNYRYGHQWWSGVASWKGKPMPWFAGFGNGGQRLYLVPDLDLAIVTTAGAYDEDATAIRVNDLVQEIIDCVER
jgi:CubicO group peptidase (beta-lactamase class C family)